MAMRKESWDKRMEARNGSRRHTLAVSWAWMGLCLGFLLIFSAGANGQVETTTRISGVVYDPTGATVPGTSVSVKDQATGVRRETITDAGGSYSFPALLPGVYTITASKPGFKTTVVQNREVEVAAPATVDITLQLGTVSQQVNVSGTGQELLTTTTAEISQTVSPTLVSNLPIERQNMFYLANLAPGAVPQDLSWGAAVTFGGFSLNVVTAANVYMPSGVILNGQRDSAQNVSLDGAMAQAANYQESTLLLSPAAISEMKIEGGNMSAEVGNGTTVVNVITKSGTNSYHGEAYDYLRNNVLDATPFFTNLLAQKLPGYQQNTFGGDFGGPIKKSKLFFFTNYEGYRLEQRTVAYDDVPSAQARQGNFSSAPDTPPIYNPWSYNATTGLRNPFPGNIIPLGATTLCAPEPTCADPTMLAYLQNWVEPPNGTVNNLPAYIGLQRTSMQSDQGTLRVDYAFGPNTTIYGRFTRSTVYQAAGGLEPLEGGFGPYGTSQAVTHWTQVLSPRAVNDLMLAWSDPSWDDTRNVSHGNVAEAIGLVGVGNQPGGPILGVPGYTMDTPSSYILETRENDVQIKDDFSYAYGKHNLKFGAELRNRRFLYQDTSFDQGDVSFAAVWTAACPSGNSTCTAAQVASGLAAGGDPLADYLIGATNGGRVNIYPAPYAGYQTYVGPFAQDSWRVTHKLTVNFGLRYEKWTPWLVPRNTAANWNAVTGQLQYVLQNPLDYLSSSACYGACGARNSGVPRAAYTTGGLNLEPRLGLALAVNNSTVFRAASGIFMDGNLNTNQFSNIQTGMPPFTLSDFLTPDITTEEPPDLMRNQFGAATPAAIPVPNTGATFRVVEPHYPTAAVYQWSASLEKKFGSKWSGELDYVGSHTVHEQFFVDLNSAQLPVGSLASVSLQDRRIFPQWGQVGSWIPINWAKYNGLTMSLKNNPWHGLSMNSTFTWAKNMSPANIYNSDGGISNTYDNYILAGPSQITPKARFVTGYYYDLPLGRGKTFLGTGNAITQGFLGGWAISGITTFSTGAPMEVTDSIDETDTGLVTDFPDRVCNPYNIPGGRTRLEWFNTNCFAQPAFGTWPNSPMGAVTFPGTNNWDLSFSKLTPTHFPKESGRIEFRADFFNAWNHTQWGDMSYTYTSSTFGQIISTRPPRVIQFTLKYMF